MTVESVSYISDLNASYPAAGDSRSEGDDHIRNLKTGIKATFPNVSGAVTPTHTELNYVDGVTSAIQTQLDAKTAISALQNQTYIGFTTGGTSTAYTLTPSPAIGAYAGGQSFFVTFHTASGATPTLQISGLATPPTLFKQLADGTYYPIQAGDIPANHRSRVTLLDASEAIVETLPPQPSVGSGQTWQNMTASRALGASYTNTTGRAIVFRVSVSSAGGPGTLSVTLSAGGVPMDAPIVYVTAAGYVLSDSLVVPPGAAYAATAGGTAGAALSAWFELRA
jgi:hypothetical protein